MSESTNREVINGAHDDLNRYISQTEAFMLLLTSPGILGDLHQKTIDDTLWLLYNRVNDIRSAYMRLCEAEQKEVNHA